MSVSRWWLAGLCRAYMRQGLRVVPFKPQNMSNNAAVTIDGGEIGRAQALQARACGLDPIVDMNPVLLKPETETGSQVIVQGRRVATVKARAYAALKPTLMGQVLQSYHRLAQGRDLVLIEGAGSPAEVNLRAGDIANMGFAEAAGVPVILVGDIDRGGVIAQLVGTKAILPPCDAARIKGFVVNKFRGDPRLFDGGRAAVVDHTGWTDMGVLPWFDDAWKLPAEDIMDIQTRVGGALKIVVPRLGRIANFDDLDPLVNEPSVTVEIVPPGRPLPADAALVLIPGSKSTIADLQDFRTQGWDIDVGAHRRRGGAVWGICGGYQMLGKTIADPDGIEGPPQTVPGLGLLDVDTVMTPHKRLVLTDAVHRPSGAGVTGYEIHIGETKGPACDNAPFQVQGTAHGAASADGRVVGTYLHGMFAADGFRRAFLQGLGAAASDASYSVTVEQTLDALAEHMERHLDLEKLLHLTEAV